ncbi:MAG: NifB/NifX family molybdenum-iron cluster-binding protein [Candidatus Competibacter sp.]|nr:NifB/NifX family molybdenum-iron cluster-binding protein [Candidatus Competibacter sp.]MDS4069965.1 NifB/NifX family molybdenum-iron cluster-binding protein [Candidatus Competibacter sp.]
MALRRHLRILAGGIKDEKRYMTPTIKAAFATSDRHKIDQHFGTASAILIYAVTPEQATVVEFAQFGDLDRDGHEDKLAAKLALLRGCAVAYCQAVGGSAIQQLLAAGVQPMRVDAGTAIAPLLAELQASLRGDGAPTWLDRAIARQRGGENADQRFAMMEAEGWQE